MQRRIVLLDMDGVLVNFVGGLVKKYELGENLRSYISKQFGTDQKCPAHLEELFPMLKIDGGFYNTLYPNFWANLDPTPWAFSLFNYFLLRPDISVYLCTSAGYLGHANQDFFRNAVLGKEQWIVKYFPSMAKRTIFAYDKTPLANGNLLIDDQESNVSKFEKAILCPAPWNDNYEIFWRGDDAVLEYLFTKLNEVFYGE